MNTGTFNIEFTRDGRTVRVAISEKLFQDFKENGHTNVAYDLMEILRSELNREADFAEARKLAEETGEKLDI